MRSLRLSLFSLDVLRGKPLAWNVVVVLITLLLLLLTGEKITSSSAYASSVAVLLGATLIMIIDFRLALLLFLAFLVGYEEFNITSEQAFLERTIENTVLDVKILGFALMDVASAVLLVPVLLREWRHAVHTGRWRWFRADLFLLPLLGVWLYGMIPGMANMNSFSDFTWDLRMLAHVAVFYFIFSRTFETREDMRRALLVMGTVFLAKHALFFFRYLTGGGLQTGVYHRVMLGSDLPLTALALGLAAAALLIFRKRETRIPAGQDGPSKISVRESAPASSREWSAMRFGLVLLTMYFLFMLIAGLGKLTYLQGLYSLIMIWALHRTEIRLRSVLAFAAAGTATALLLFVTVLSPASRDVILYALTHAFNWWDALKIYGDLSFGTRLFELINIWDQLVREGDLLFGQGWGAPWRELAVHMPFDGGAFALEEQYSGVHVQAHVDAVTFLLKVGIVGTLVIYGSMFRFWLTGIRIYRTALSARDRWVLMALLLMIVIFAPNYLYFIRLKYLLGFALAGITVFSTTYESLRASHTRIADPDHAE
ncbi:MAG: hypothetical protein JXA28_00325 [Bacteroidetes bacterium]|nr:hypothetical protein [Bacteroidota bacterium]